MQTLKVIFSGLSIAILTAISGCSSDTNFTYF